MTAPCDFPICPICQGRGSPRYAAAEYLFYRCDGCRSGFVSPTPTDEALTAFYDRYHRAISLGGAYASFEDRMAADFPAKVAMVRAKCGPEPTCRILDVGCGKGFFVKACVDAGMDAEGVDLSPSGIAFGKEQLGLRLHQGHLGALKSALGQFDVVTFWATIEHLPDPVAMMRDIADVLKPGGRLLLDTGIGDDWLERLLPGVTQWYDPPEHLFVLTEEGMKIALEKAGLHLESFSPNFERSGARRMIKTVRNGALAAGLRTIAELGGAMQREVTFMRFPLGNLMSATATKPT